MSKHKKICLILYLPIVLGSKLVNDRGSDKKELLNVRNSVNAVREFNYNKWSNLFQVYFSNDPTLCFENDKLGMLRFSKDFASNADNTTPSLDCHFLHLSVETTEFHLLTSK